MGIVRYVIILGFMFAFIGIIIALPLPVEDRAFGLSVFMIGFFLVAAGIVLNMINISKVSGGKSDAVGFRIITIGFGVVLLSSLLSTVIEQENIVHFLYIIGWVVFVMGIVISILSQKKN